MASSKQQHIEPCKETETLKEVLHGVVEMHVSSSADRIISTVKDGVRVITEACANEDGVNKLIDGHNAIVDRVNEFSEVQAELKDTVLNQLPKFIEKAAHSEHISYKVRGQLGATERKRRKVDLDEIGRLRYDNGKLHRQMRDKDKMVEIMSGRIDALSVRLAIVSNEQDEMRREMVERQISTEETMVEMRNMLTTLVARALGTDK